MTTSSHTEIEKSFADFNIRPDIVEALAIAGIVSPFPIQALTLPVALSGHDIIGQAKTGTGKTLGFGLPLLNKVIAPDEPGFDELPAPGKPQALVIVPTRELAVQVAKDLEIASTKRSVRIVQLYGGRAYEPQIESLKRGAEVIVGTPGRMIDMLKQRHLTLMRAQVIVLDEADEMLDLGFLPDVEKILAQTPAVRQMMLFSATMPGAVVAMARRYMTQPTHIRAQDPEDAGSTVKNIKQVVFRAHPMDKMEMIARILQSRGRGLSVIFTRTKRTAAKVAEELTERGFAAGALHGDLGQGAREQALRAFRNGKVDILVATDVAARGIDVENVTHVINYQVPEDAKVYLHRTGRTGRAGNKGTAVTFVDWDDLHVWTLINKALELGIPEPLETYSSSPHLFTDLDIPEGTKGRLPQGMRTRAGLAAEDLEDVGETGKRTPTPRREDKGARPAQVGGNRRPPRDESSRGSSDDSAERSPRRPRTRRRASEDNAASTVVASPVTANSDGDSQGAVDVRTPAAEKSGGERPRRNRQRRRRSNGSDNTQVAGTEQKAAQE
ncbi:DEAD/DEAH box helicase [Jonesia quinghaiensis]|uniref:DEAD/DEAH box helicase n=1 Tax=Jonesia quinghaiensis TaxID=262806 RepID=UPI000411917A|nr:DEAD/DEAH box helicase [Jonesia quinghaiensis]